MLKALLRKAGEPTLEAFGLPSERSSTRSRQASAPTTLPQQDTMQHERISL